MINNLYLIFGPPGSGKTAQAQFLADRLGLQNLSWGRIYWDKRYEKKYKKDLSIIKSIKTPDKIRSEIIGKVIDRELGQLPKGNNYSGIVLDGFPRRVSEAKLLLKICRKRNLKIKALIRINPSFSSAIGRFRKRYLCPLCSSYYDEELSRPGRQGLCDRDGAKLRPINITEKEILEDLTNYFEENVPAFDLLKEKAECYFDVSGDDEGLLVFSNILIKLKNKEKSDYYEFIRLQSVPLETKYGTFRLIPYQSKLDYSYHLVLLRGRVAGKRKVLVRVHSSCITGDAFGSLKCDCGEQLMKALQSINKEGSGILIYLFQEGRGINIINKVKTYKLQKKGMDTVEANEKIGFPPELRNYRPVLDIIRDLGIKSINLLTNNPDKVSKLTELGIIIEERIPLLVTPTKHNKSYLLSKREKMGHKIDNLAE